MSYQGVLDAARTLFARQGYHGTSVRDITDAAGINVGAITYHFGSKLDLYHRVLRDFTEPLARKLSEASDASLPPIDRIERRIRVFFQHQREHPEMVPLMVREMTHAEDLAEPIKEMMGTVLPRLVGDIVAGQKAGSIRAGDPTLLALSSMAQPIYLNLARKGLAIAMRKDPLAPEVFDTVVNHCVEIVRTMLVPGADRAGTRPAPASARGAGTRPAPASARGAGTRPAPANAQGAGTRPAPARRGKRR